MDSQENNSIVQRKTPLDPPPILRSLVYEINRGSKREASISFYKDKFGESTIYSLRFEYKRSTKDQNKSYGGGETAVLFGEDHVLSDKMAKSLKIPPDEHEVLIREHMEKSMLITIAQEGLESKWRTYNEQSSKE